MHAAMLRTNVSSTATTQLLAIFRLSDAEVPPADAPPALTSSLHYVILDGASLRPVATPLGTPRLLPLPTPPTPQLLSGPEDARLFSLAGRACMVYNDVQRDSGHADNGGGGGDATIRVVDTTTWGIVGVMQGHTAGIYQLLVREGKLWSCSDDTTIKVWSTGEGRECEEPCCARAACAGFGS